MEGVNISLKVLQNDAIRLGEGRVQEDLMGSSHVVICGASPPSRLGDAVEMQEQATQGLLATD